MEYPDWLERIWTNRPRRENGDSKRACFKACKARIRQGDTVEDLEAGHARYKAYCEHKGWIGTCYVKQASTFFGPDGHFEEEWAIPEEAKEPEYKRPTSGANRMWRAPIDGPRSSKDTAMAALRNVRPR
jgi:hypothetical protein